MWFFEVCFYLYIIGGVATATFFLGCFIQSGLPDNVSPIRVVVILVMALLLWPWFVIKLYNE